MSAPQGPSGGDAASGPDSGLKIWSCVICRRRKIRCDRRDPCANCIKSNIDCHYPVTGRIPRRSRDPGAWKSPTQKQSELLSRLRRLETVVTELAGQVEEGSTNRWTTPSSSGPGSSIHADEAPAIPATASRAGSTSARAPVPNLSSQPGSEFDEDFGRLVIDKDGGLHVGNRFWTVFCSEVDNILQAVHDVAEYDAEPDASAMLDATLQGSGTSQGHQGFVFGSRATVGGLDSLCPLPSQMPFIWNTYVERVDPFIKILHLSGMEDVIRGLRGKFSSLGPDTEALLFAISLAAIASLDEDEVVINFDTGKAQLLARYRFGTEQALARADFLITREISVLQALVIYLSILPHLDANSVAWSLTGVLIRLAKALGLHTERGNSGRSAGDAELRRRLWWQICFIDSRTRKSAIADVSISSGSFDTHLPAGCDDVDLMHSRSPAAVAESSPSTLCRIRCEIWQLVQSLHAISSQDIDRLAIFREGASRIRNSHLRNERLGSAWGMFIKTMTSLFFAQVELALCCQKAQSAGAASDPKAVLESSPLHYSMLSSSLVILQTIYSLKSEQGWSKWRWQLQAQFPWHAAGVFLQQASKQLWNPTLERAWEMTNSMFEAIPIESKDAPSWKSLERILEETRRHRDQELVRIASRGQTMESLAQIDLETPLLFEEESREVGAIQDMPSGWVEDTWLALSVEPPQQVLGDARASFGTADMEIVDWQSLEGLEGVDMVWDMVDFW